MKYKLILILFAFLLASCGNTNEKKIEAHNHEDSTAHTDCCEGHEHAKPQQESFEIEADSAAIKNNAVHVHDKDDGHDHDHEHKSNQTHKH